MTPTDRSTMSSDAIVAAVPARAESEDETIGFLLWQISRGLMRVLADTCAQHGIPSGVWPVLRTLGDEDGLTQRDLVERLGIRGPTVVEIIAQLERRGLIVRDVSTVDKRKAHIRVTDLGHEMIRRVKPDVRSRNEANLTGLSLAERKQLKKLLSRFRDNLGLT